MFEAEQEARKKVAEKVAKVDSRFAHLAWVENTSYKVGDIVSRGSALFRCILPHQATFGIIPEYNDILWTELSDDEVVSLTKRKRSDENSEKSAPKRIRIADLCNVI